MTKKGQSEAIGIAIVVFLLIMLMLFVLYLNTSNRPLEFGEASLLADNFLNVLVDTATSCSDKSFIDLVDDCVGDKILSCPESSCVFAKKTAIFLLNETFGRRNMDYYFAMSGHNDLELSQGNSCVGDRDAGYYSYNNYGRNIEFKLYLCR